MMMVFIVGFASGMMFTALGLLIFMHHQEMKKFR